MAIEFIGMLQPRRQSEIHPPEGEAIDPAYLLESARVHERGGFDRVLIGWYSDGPDPLLLGTAVGLATSRLGLMIAHRPGFAAPSVAARAFATLDRLTGGRAAIHVITGGDDRDCRRDGDTLDKEARYRRTDEYVSVLKRIWTADRPVDHTGEHYRIEGASPAVRSVAQPHIPIYFGGASDAAIVVAGRHADIYALWGETAAQVREITARVRLAAAAHGRALGFSLSFRPILGGTEAEAWRRARDIADRVRDARRGSPPPTPGNIGSRRLLDAAAAGDRPEGILYTAIARETGARGNSTALVGTPEQVATALRDYYRLGVSTFLVRGFDPLEDAADYGESLLPLTRRLVERETERAA